MNDILSRLVWHRKALEMMIICQLPIKCESAPGTKAVVALCVIKYLTYCSPFCYCSANRRATVNSRKSKRSALQELRAWNAHPEKVKAPLFASHPFFDPEDKAQVKYEMLRRREAETAPLEVTCHEFGFTRESYRHILGRFRSEGMGGLFELKRGRRNPLKANDEVRGLLSNAHAQDPSLGPDQLARHCQETIGVTLSRRTVYRVLAAESERKKKRRTNKLRSRRG